MGWFWTIWYGGSPYRLYDLVGKGRAPGFELPDAWSGAAMLLEGVGFMYRTRGKGDVFSVALCLGRSDGSGVVFEQRGFAGTRSTRWRGER